jgi:hypothetical protein
MKKKTPSLTSAAPNERTAKEARAVYAAPFVVRAIYRGGRFEPREPIAMLSENQSVELVVQINEDNLDLRTRAALIVQRARQRAADQAASLTRDEAWAAYDRAAAALRRELR